MKKLSLTSFILLLLPAMAFGQTSSSKIVGTVTDSTGSPVIYASILLKPSVKGTTTDLKRNYTISNVTRGSYQVEN